MSSPPDSRHTPTAVGAHPEQVVRSIGQYDLVEPIGQGGMGVVWKASHRHLDQIVAIKLLPQESWTDPRAVRRFYREMRAGGRVVHPNVVRAMDAGEYDQRHVLVMEYVAGQTLSELLHRAGVLPVAIACEIIRQAATGLEAIHAAGMTHRDLKPSNLFVTTGGMVKILDLGLARLPHEDDEEELTASGILLGTMDYMPPEQSRDPRNVDARADLYSLGGTLYTLLNGSPPFAGRKLPLESRLRTLREDAPAPLSSLRLYIPDEVSALVQQLLSKDPDDRIQTAASLVECLQPWCEGVNLAGWLETVRGEQLQFERPGPAGPASIVETEVSSRPVTASEIDTSFASLGSSLHFVEPPAPPLNELANPPSPAAPTASAPVSTSGTVSTVPRGAETAVTSPGGDISATVTYSRPQPLAQPAPGAARQGVFTLVAALLVGGAIAWFAFLTIFPEQQPRQENGEPAIAAAVGGLPAEAPLPGPARPAAIPEEEPTAATLRDFSTAPDLVWQSLLDHKPAVVFWKRGEGLAQWDWKAELQQVHLASDDYGLLGLGTTSADGYTLQVDIHQSRWTSGAGVFVGLQGWSPDASASTPPWNCCWLQIAETRKGSEDAPGLWVVQLERLQGSIGKEGIPQIISSAIASEPIRTPAGEELLELNVANGRLTRVRLGGQSLRELVSVSSQLVEADAWSGGFGIVAGSASATFRNAQFKRSGE